MKTETRKKLEAAGWRVGDAEEFLGLSQSEAEFLETQAEFAKVSAPAKRATQRWKSTPPKVRAGMLIETLDGEPEPGVEAAWAEEVERRVREIESGAVEMIPWEQVRAELVAPLTDESQFPSRGRPSLGLLNRRSRIL